MFWVHGCTSHNYIRINGSLDCATAYRKQNYIFGCQTPRRGFLVLLWCCTCPVTVTSCPRWCRVRWRQVLSMSSTTDNSVISASNDVGAPVTVVAPRLIQTQTTLEAPAPHSAEPPPTPDVISPSTRTSMTRVDHDEDSGPRQSISHEPATIPTAPSTPAQQAAVNNNNISSSSLPFSSVVQNQPPLSMSTSPLAEISTSEQHHVGAATVSVPKTPQTYVTFLHISGRRRTMAFDPETTIGRLKELVWNSWPAGTVVLFFWGGRGSYGQG
jgi:hypothetical protein